MPLSLPALLLLTAAQGYGESPYLFGLHEPGGERHMAEKGKRGWILFTEEVGRDPANRSGKDFRPWADAGYGVLVRINHGYGPTQGTIPYEAHYDAFAQRVANYVQNSPGAHLWIIGNETNLPVEWPRYLGPEERITAARYAACFAKCRAKIKALPGHSGDAVIVQPTAPWNDQVGQGWIEYHAEVLHRLGSGGLDGIAIHTYTHGSDPNLIYSTAKMNPPYQDRYYNFYAYRDFMNAIPSWARSLPVYLTEMTQTPGGWADVNSGWVKNAYKEIHWWNQQSGTQKIRAAILYRWPRLDDSYIDGKWGVINDFRDAMNNDYRWATSPPPSTTLPDVIVESVGTVPSAPKVGDSVTFFATVRNQGGGPTPSGTAIGVAYFVNGQYITWGAVSGPLAAGASVRVGTNASPWTAPSVGTFALLAHVDDVNRFAESNESNNTKTASVTVSSSAPPPATVGEDFETMPFWDSTHNAGWGSAATWSVASGGQSGNFLQGSRGSAGSSTRVKVFSVPANAAIEVSAYLKCPSQSSGYWMEFAYRLGNHGAADFDANAAAWTMVKKFSSGGTNGNGNAWTRYAASVSTGSATEISIGFKLGSSPGGGPTVGWDTLRIGGATAVLGWSASPEEPAAGGEGGGGACGALGLETVFLLALRRLRRRG